MIPSKFFFGKWPGWLAVVMLVAGVLPLAAACGGERRAPPATPTATGPAVLPSPTPTSVFLKLLKTSPERGPAGTAITLSGQGLPPGKEAEIIWVTSEGRYDTKESAEGLTLGVAYKGRTYTEKRLSLGRSPIGSDGSVTASLAAPEDYGEVHDIYLAVDGQDVAKGGFRLLRTYAMSPEQGPVGSLITIKITGLGSRPFENTAALLYDNKYTGFISATTTHGTAVAQFRAAGPVGKHYISVHAASHAQPFLNATTGAVGTRHLAPFEAVFTVTRDDGPPMAKVEWPDPARVAEVSGMSRIPSMGEVVSTPGVSARISPATGPVLGKASLRASGLAAGPADLVWVAAGRNDPLGAAELVEGLKLASVTVAQNGAVEAAITIPEDVGGWHLVKVAQNGKTVVDVPFYVEQSLVTPVPVRVKSGDKFTVWFRGGGWTELDNGVAVTYDNAYVGYVCGFANNGDTPVELVATGGVGTHLIDIYPYIFDGGNADYPWQYQLPQLTALDDHPGLGLGYRLPIFRLAVEVMQ